MNQTEICCISSSDSDSSVADEGFYSKNKPSGFSEFDVDANKSKKNIYTLSESEDETRNEKSFSNIEQQSFKTKKSEDVLLEISEKYLNISQSYKLCQEKIIVLPESSSESEDIDDGKAGCSKIETIIPLMDHKNHAVLENYDCQENKMSKRSFNSLTNFSKADSHTDNESKVLKKTKRTVEAVSSSTDNEYDDNVSLGKTKKIRQKKTLDTKKIRAEEKKALREREKIRKKEHLEKEKALKHAQKMIDKTNKPEECLKYMIVNMDDTILNNREYGQYLKEHLTGQNISCRLKTSYSGMVSWSRRVLKIENMLTKETESQEKHYAVVIKPQAFGNLFSCIQSIKDQTDFKHLTIFVFGQSKPTSSQEDEIMNIEMFFHTYWQFVKNKEELASSMFMLTKSIAQIPYKLQQEEKYKQNSEYFEDCNKDLVKIDKNGNGLGKLWQQMLTMFPLVRLETAGAITAVYSTPSALFEAYENCSENGEQLIQDLPVRRTQGPLASNRRLGPELSKKCYRFFTAEENILL